MTPILLLGHGVLAAGWLASSRWAPGARDRAGRVLGGIGIALGVATVLARGSLRDWRAIEVDPTTIAIAGTAAACAWGLVLALDLGASRWWAGGLTGVSATGLLLMTGAAWTVPALLFLLCSAVPAYVACARGSRAAWLALALADAALVGALVSDAVSRDSWAGPPMLGGMLAVPLAAAIALRLGAVVHLVVHLRSPVAASIPISAGLGLIALVRWVERPAPVAAAAALLVALVAVAWPVLNRRMNPATVALWPIALAGGLCLISPAATLGAAVSGLLGLSAVALWPDAIERGRLTRGFLLSGAVPNVIFGALATAASVAFANATLDGPVREAIAWNLVSGLLPVLCALGVALGVFVARADQAGGYHPEAVLMTWILLAASVIAGGILGAGAVYGALGGTPALVLSVLAVAAGAAAAIRAAPVDGVVAAYSAVVVAPRTYDLPFWVTWGVSALHVGSVAALGWLTWRGLQGGFL